jgi:hypothetical protein
MGGTSERPVGDASSRLFISCHYHTRRPSSARVEDRGDITVPHDSVARPGPWTEGPVVIYTAIKLKLPPDSAALCNEGKSTETFPVTGQLRILGRVLTQVSALEITRFGTCPTGRSSLRNVTIFTKLEYSVSGLVQRADPVSEMLRSLQNWNTRFGTCPTGRSSLRNVTIFTKLEYSFRGVSNGQIQSPKCYDLYKTGILVSGHVQRADSVSEILRSLQNLKLDKVQNPRNP